MGFQWSTANHDRLQPEIQDRIVQLLLIQQRTRCIHKDVLINHVIPAWMGPIVNPVVYVGDLSWKYVGRDMNGQFVLRDRLEECIGPVVSLKVYYGQQYAMVEFRRYRDAMYALSLENPLRHEYGFAHMKDTFNPFPAMATVTEVNEQ